MNKAFTEISAGIDSAIAHAKGEPNHNVVEHPIKTIDVKAIREKTGMSQQQFCSTFGISLGTLRHWEQGFTALKLRNRSPSLPRRGLGGG
ncbi:MAG: helix-turn-helix domain-containing protein [Thioploca sp.]|nr:helix-turn-helix domain-containing protein [Thioploca sp.]